MFDLNAFIDATPEGCAVRVDNHCDDFRLVRETADEVKRVSSDPGKMHVVTTIQRPGATEWSFAVEQRMYSPLDSAKNEQFSTRFLRWCDLIWVIVSVPRSDETALRAMTGEMEMKLVDGVPHVLGSEGIQVFPVTGPNVYSLEGYGGHDPNETRR